jgi:hypothetical protein
VMTYVLDGMIVPILTQAVLLVRYAQQLVLSINTKEV